MHEVTVALTEEVDRDLLRGQVRQAAHGQSNPYVRYLSNTLPHSHTNR
jgi:hypothetical protein